MMRPNATTNLLAIIATTVMTFSAGNSWAACMNKFVAQTQGNKRVVTLLTGAMTFPEASDIAKGIADKSLQPIEWLDDKGKPIATSMEFNAVRPMPVACGDKASGAVVTVGFVTFVTPSKLMIVKFPNGVTVTFEEQTK